MYYILICFFIFAIKIEKHNSMTNRNLTSDISDFVQLRNEGLLYIDKTMYIPLIENASNYLFLVRPHGFGQTTLISMMRAYYDINLKDQWDNLFGDLYIGMQPTSERSAYMVMTIDYSSISGNIYNLKKEIYEIFANSMRQFARSYDHLIPGLVPEVEQIIASLTPLQYASRIVNLVHSAGFKFYLFVDGYDSVVEVVLRNGGKLNYADFDLMNNVSAFMRFFDAIDKAHSIGLTRMFACGVSPMITGSVFNGFRDGRVVIMNPEFAYIEGFTENDVRIILENHPRLDEFNLSIDDVVIELYNRAGGYCFNPAQVNKPMLFNPHKVMRFLEAFEKAGFTMPSSTSDCEICTLLSVRDAQYDAKTSTLKYPFEGELIVAEVEELLSLDRLNESRSFVSMLYYYGLLSIRGERWNSLILGIPNHDAKRQIAMFLDKLID